MKKEYSLVSLFAGVGGLDMGFEGGFSYKSKTFEKQPFKIISAYEKDGKCVETIKLNSNGQQFPSPIQKGFTFENVGFKYPNSEMWALRHLNFQIPPGEKLALVGENGAGKTTLVKLLARLYEPNEGRILLDGKDLREYDLKSKGMGATGSTSQGEFLKEMVAKILN